MGSKKKSKKRKNNATRKNTSKHYNNNKTINNKNHNKKKTTTSHKSGSNVQSKSLTGPIRKGTDLKALKKKNKKEKKSNSKVKKVILISVIVIALMLLIAGGIFVGIFFSDKFAITKEDLLISTSNTMVYDAEGNVILELSSKENRKIVSIDDGMNPHLPDAFVAIEDERFYKHKGIDVKRTAAATVTYITHGGSSNFGGSTITQQLVKNITNEKDSSGTAGMQRKIKEMSRAYQIEKMLDKRQILELYLNLIPLGSSGGDICGVEMASIYYFNKTAKDLSIEECAFIAGVTHSPSQYNPYKENPNTDRIISRTKTVLGKMKDLGFISQDEYNTAVANVDAGLNFQKGEMPNSNIKSYFVEAAVDQVVKELVEEKGMSEEYAKTRVFSGGLKIYTTQISSIQNAVQTEYQSGNYVRNSGLVEGQHTQSAMVIMDHTTGKVVGCMGGLGTDVDAIGINRIFSPRQPGSSIKPIGVYGPALEKGIITGATIYDNTYPTTFGGTYRPPNASSAKSGLCTIRDAIEVSANIVACKVMSELGPDNAIDFMRQYDITSLVKASEVEAGAPNDSNLSTALGGVTYGVNTLQMAAAYACIANDGVYIEPTFYTKVEDSAGNIVIEPTQETRQVFSAATAYVLKNLLKQPVEGGNGTARVCRMDYMDVGAKTGTTNDQFDVWLCGFTPYYTAATWFGYDKNEYVNTYGGSPATLLWATVMKNIHAGLEGRTFVKPDNVYPVKVCRVSGKCATGACSDTYTEYFAEGTVPAQCEGHNSFVVCSETHKLATEFCEHTEEVKGIAKPEKEMNASWQTNGDGKYTIITEHCNVHTAEYAKKKQEEEEERKKRENSDITIPNVVGKSEAEAVSALGKLNVSKEYKSDSSKPNGTVLSQNINPGSVVSKEAKITIVINKIQNTPSTPPATNTTPPATNTIPPTTNTTPPVNTTPPAQPTNTVISDNVTVITNQVPNN